MQLPFSTNGSMAPKNAALKTNLSYDTMGHNKLHTQ